jgi:DNA polymerase III subunit delta
MSPPEDTRSAKVPALFLFYGDEFLVKERVCALIEDRLPAGLRETNLVAIDGASLDASVLAAEVFTSSLFGGPRVVLVEQTTVFMGRTNRSKVVDKILQSWVSHDRRSAFRAMAQLFAVVGVEPEELHLAGDKLAQELSASVPSRDLDILGEVAREFVAEGKTLGRAGDEAALEAIFRRNFPAETTLILTAPEVDDRKRLVKTVKAHGEVLECRTAADKRAPALDKDYFRDRVRSALSAARKTISPRALDAMYARTGKQLRALHSELEKLISYVGGRSEITADDINAVFSDFHETAFFELSNAVRSGDLGRSLAALHENLRIVDTPLQTLGSIANEVRRLIAAREALSTVLRPLWKPGMTFNQFAGVLKELRRADPEMLKTGPFALLSSNEYGLYMHLKEAQKFGMGRLVVALEALLEADILMKSSRVGAQAPQAVLENVLVSLLGRD